MPLKFYLALAGYFGSNSVVGHKINGLPALQTLFIKTEPFALSADFGDGVKLFGFVGQGGVDEAVK